MVLERIKVYYKLAKPGIIYGNAITAIGGFFLAERGHFNLILFIAMLLGISLVMASGCVFNNYIDKDIDALMARTKKRALVSGDVSPRSAITYASILGLLGSLILWWGTNLLTLGIALFGLFAYVVLYGVGKRRSVHGTLIGSISGAIPPVVGYCAVVNRFDGGALLLFLIVAIWQMPHFYAIAMYRLNDYAAASIPVLPIKKGMQATKVQILVYIVLFTVVAALLSVCGYVNYIYLGVMATLSLAWVWQGLKTFKTSSDPVWGRSMFRFSLVIITVFSIMIAVGPILP